MEPIRVGLIGCSPVAMEHARHLLRTHGAVLAAVADPDPERAKAAGEQAGGARVFTDHAALLREGGVAAAIVSVPTWLHARVGMDVLRAGVHALIEKPPACSRAEVLALRAAAAAGSARVMFGYQRRHDPRHGEARRRIAEGELGRLYYARAAWINARFNPQQNRHCYQWKARGAAMASLGSHFLDFTWWLMGEPRPLRAVAWAHRDFCAEKAPDDPGDDLMAGMVWLEGDRLLRIEAARRLHAHPQAFGEVYGERGSYSDRGVFLSVPADGPPRETMVPGGGADDKTVQCRLQMEHFLRRVRGETVPGMDLDQAVVFQSMIDALYESAETGRVAEIEG